MVQGKLTGLRSVELGVADLSASTRFYTEIWGLTPVVRTEKSVFLRGSAAYHHIVALHRRSKAELLSVTFNARSRGDVDALHAVVQRAEAAAIEAPGLVNEPSGGYGFAFQDPEGRILRVVAGDERYADAAPVSDRPHQLAHVVLNSEDVPKSRDFFVDVLGFRLTDQTQSMNFITCNDHHHNIALARGSGPTLNHVAFEMRDLESLMRGAGRLRDHGYAIEWGVGRHGPGDNVFAYFIAPEDYVVEYTAEVLRIDASYRTGKPEDWRWPPGRVDHWGISDPPSERMKVAQQKIRFAETLMPVGG